MVLWLKNSHHQPCALDASTECHWCWALQQRMVWSAELKTSRSEQAGFNLMSIVPSNKKCSYAVIMNCKNFYWWLTVMCMNRTLSSFREEQTVKLLSMKHWPILWEEKMPTCLSRKQLLGSILCNTLQLPLATMSSPVLWRMQRGEKVYHIKSWSESQLLYQDNWIILTSKWGMIIMDRFL